MAVGISRGVRTRWPTRCLLLVAVACLGACSDDGVRDVLPPGTRVDTFQQASVSKVDVLVVVDNSSSMVEEQENLGRNFDRFLGYLTQAKIDFHIGVTTTDVVNDKGRLKNADGYPAVITSQTPDPIKAFAANVKQQNVGGNAREAGLDAARLTFELKPPGFLRSDAWLFLIFVSDEDDHSQPGMPKYYYRSFSQLKGKGNEGMIRAGAIVGDVPSGCVSDSAVAEPGVRYKEFVDLMGGRVGSICSEEFADILREMGLDAVGLKRKFQITKVPDLESIEITTVYDCDADQATLDKACASVQRSCGTGGEGVLCTVRPLEQGGEDGWEYEVGSNSLVFHGAAIPPKGASVEVVYLEPEPS